MGAWAFFDGEGHEYTRGLEGTTRQARAHAQALADQHGKAIEFQSEASLLRPDGADDDWEPEPGEVVQPAQA